MRSSEPWSFEVHEQIRVDTATSYDLKVEKHFQKKALQWDIRCFIDLLFDVPQK